MISKIAATRLSCGALLAFSVIAAGSLPALATCYDEIQALPCWGGGKKCNIKFRNHTGEVSGSGGGEYNQISSANTVRISARKADGKRAGSNTLSIDAGGNKTLNLDKKQDFDRIRIEMSLWLDYGNDTVSMECADVKDVLEENATCKLFVHQEYRNSTVYDYAAYSCNGGKVRYSAGG